MKAVELNESISSVETVKVYLNVITGSQDLIPTNIPVRENIPLLRITLKGVDLERTLVVENPTNIDDVAIAGGLLNIGMAYLDDEEFPNVYEISDELLVKAGITSTDKIAFVANTNGNLAIYNNPY